MFWTKLEFCVEIQYLNAISAFVKDRFNTQVCGPRIESFDHFNGFV